MAEVLTLAAQPRARVGKGASRALRRQGLVPAVIYGNKETPVAVHIEEKRLVKLLDTGFFLNSTVEVEVEGAKIHTLPRDVQFHPVTDRPVHVDFLRVGADTVVIVNVPVHFLNEAASPGLKRGGVLNVVRHEIEVHVPANAIPDFIAVDVSGYDVGDTIHISKVTLPEGVRPVIERDFTIATIAAPSSLQSEEAAAEADETPAEEGPAGV